MGPADLTAALTHLGHSRPDARVLVGHDTHDDAGVFRLTDDTALVQTVDFFTPVVDDPRTFGAIAAVNSLSDIYAMGATPLTALNLVAFPADRLPPAVLGEMLEGGRAVLDEARVSLLGGHSIDDPEPKMGYAVTGVVHPDHIWRNSTASEGDILFLTKAIGTGVVVKGIKDGTVSQETADAAIHAMLTSNRAAWHLLRQLGGPTACTDVTGFGLLGHLWEMADGAGRSVTVQVNQVPVLPGARALAEADQFPGGSRNNRTFFEPHVQQAGRIEPWRLGLLYDAVTAGGLLFSVAPNQLSAVTALFQDAHTPLYRIGQFGAAPPTILLDLARSDT